MDFIFRYVGNNLLFRISYKQFKVQVNFELLIYESIAAKYIFALEIDNY